MHNPDDAYDVAIIGAGIVGLATAHFLHQSEPDRRIVVIDKEAGPGQHQTGHNSGVIHAGIYYAPGSLKAKLCTAGAKATKAFCDTHEIAYENCGKLIVATDTPELTALDELERRATQNGQIVQPVSREELAEREPMVRGVRALFSPASGIVDYGEICRVLHKTLEISGVDFLFGQAVTGLEERTNETLVATSGGELSTRLVVACAGLQADRIAALSGVGDDFRIIPFRGEYYRVADHSNVQVNHLIYPVPDPSLPFLGVHLTKMIGGYSTVGPNAMFSLGRETYSANRPVWRDLGRSLAFPGFWKLMARSLRPGLHELSGSLLKSVYLKRCQRYCPDLSLSDLEPYEPGIRAQAVDASGKMIDDFLLRETRRSIHVCNAPSPAATSAFPIGEEIGARVLKKLEE
ncbi:L-2-hydroxyglutarate oxidase LhgO (plasmid) [Phaeobacter inhibens]|uniref:L-2-hydroxyglutarate oxidase LhgO n=1 Tax=Phaeobacter inhibens TaxID=221822 RepID=A0ABN5GTW9_9RHOB|nr:L-2-hydroxyglutarate oxidase [Phaeobacter inhibens]AUQ52458.1 L-2-hydroxyglutarate oxidase LhgO [Phaeobacter inhibens]AUQ97063.1 L-2-hydroxyglutarate oxidase LhgO [Phaeobacter inhibens]AUR22263.1 L-2-hydroxyglutarate oxidase LhgO [Phaeobacter inhibens]